MVKRENLIYETNKYIFNFQKFQTIRCFAKNIYDSKTTLDNADKDQDDL